MVTVTFYPQMVRTAVDLTLTGKSENDTGERSDGHYLLFMFILCTSCKQRIKTGLVQTEPSK